MPYNFAAESFHTKKLCSRLSSRKVQFSVLKTKKLSPLRPLWGLGATYAVHLRLIGKLVHDFLLVIIELVSLGAFVLSQFTRVTDRRMDGRTDGRTALRSRRPRLHTMQRDNNCSLTYLSCTVSVIWWIIGPTFALYTMGGSL